MRRKRARACYARGETGHAAKECTWQVKGGKSTAKGWWNNGWKGKGLWAVDEQQNDEELDESYDEAGGVEAINYDAEPTKIETPKVQQNQKAKDLHGEPIKICSSTCAGQLQNICTEKCSDISAEKHSDICALIETPETAEAPPLLSVLGMLSEAAIPTGTAEPPIWLKPVA